MCDCLQENDKKQQNIVFQKQQHCAVEQCLLDKLLWMRTIMHCDDEKM
jgi:hypothetical protein